ncbi:MAG: ATP-binding protein [Pseudomonadota bacterium]
MKTDQLNAIDKAVILLVDDDPNNLDALGAVLLPHYEILAAPSGERALQIAAARKPDLLLLDVSMPGMDGYAVMERLHAAPDLRDIPVIFVTGRDAEEDEERGFRLGAADYITKPYRVPVILSRVRSQLELKRARDRLVCQNACLEEELARRMKENHQVQMQLLQSEKMAAVGQLAAGVAHEINNPVGFVTSNLASLNNYLHDLFALLDAYETLEAGCPPEDAALARVRQLKQQTDIAFVRADTPQLLTESRQGLERVAKIVRDLKGLSHAAGSDWQWANLHDGLDATLNVAWNELKYRCTLHKEYGEIPKVYCIPSQLNQVFLNLLVNAAQAITESGDITLRTGRTEGEVFIAVADTGTGISAEHQARLFEPFFTTKPVGKGTGLGLSISRDIVRRHQGRIEVESTEGEGTTFTVWLPIGNPDAAVAS